MRIYRDVSFPEYLLNHIEKHDSQILGYLDTVRSEFDIWFENLIGQSVTTHDSWINFIHYTGKINGYDWHNEKGIQGSGTVMEGEYACISWIDGDVNCGGELFVMNGDNIQAVDFAPNTLMIFKADTLHKVGHYFGDIPRISLNFTFDYDK